MKNFDIHAAITNRIIEQLSQGVIPWHKPWKVSGIKIKGANGLRHVAFNRITKTAYSPLNQMLLSRAGEYATFAQWKKLGGTIRKGAKSEMVVFWSTGYKKKGEDDDGNEIDVYVTYDFPVLKFYNVFHIHDVEGVAPLEQAALNEGNAETFDSIETAERIAYEYSERERCEICYGGESAFYSPMLDYVQIPCRAAFGENVGGFYSTLFHELTHSTGAESRLNRLEKGQRFGNESYSKEELTAELGAAGLLSILGIETESTFTNSAAYIQNWLQVLKNDNKMIVSAATRAEKAIKYIINGKERETGAA